MRLRAPRPSDAPAILEVIQARDRADFGVPDFTLGDLQDEWKRSAFDLANDAVVGELSDGAIVAYAAIRRVGSLAVIAPSHEGAAIGGRLLAWAQGRERELGRERHRTASASSDERGKQLLRAAGYDIVFSHSRMTLELAASDFADAGTPAGVVLRALERERDARAVYGLDAEAFADSPDYVPMTLTAFCEEHLNIHDHAPELSAVAERAGALAGFLLARRWTAESVGYVEILAVAPGHQRAGIGTALLRRALAAFAAAGLREAQLGVASTNPGALRLYERLGMTPRFQVDVYELAACSEEGSEPQGERKAGA